MIENEVVVFREYPLKEGQKINIAEGPRRGDWLVIEVSPRKVRLRCPVSGREVEWDRFFCYAETRNLAEWPAR